MSTQQQLDALTRYQAHAIDIDAAAGMYGVSVDEFRAMIRDSGGKLHSGSPRMFDHDEAFQLYGKLKSYSKVGDQLGVSAVAVWKALKIVRAARAAARMSAIVIALLLLKFAGPSHARHVPQDGITAMPKGSICGGVTRSLIGRGRRFPS